MGNTSTAICDDEMILSTSNEINKALKNQIGRAVPVTPGEWDEEEDASLWEPITSTSTCIANEEKSSKSEPLLEPVSSLSSESLDTNLQDDLTELQEAKDQSSSYSSSVLDTVKAALDSIDYDYDIVTPDNDDDDGHIRLEYTVTEVCEGCDCAVVIMVDEETRLFRYYLDAPLRVPLAKRRDVAILLTCINYYTFVGNFEMDLRDGQLRYRCSCKVVEGHSDSSSVLGVGMVKDAMEISQQMLEKYFPGMMQVVYAGKDPEQAYQDCWVDEIMGEDEEEEDDDQSMDGEDYENNEVDASRLPQ
ncbi:Pfam:DUF1790 [Seminavis robusta]|uniref:Pfam:DUF1790 n=1 Tax=Seminavis robusta TaxID=568900 RepID=A0A9N8D9W0_9STRA|nr:Pfam:DUF1790 [Seminavis robusta]|eukprot:Sro28_g018580.1 Pfam:DUF1790 (304) ;mRNA; f:33091-34002